MLNTMLHWQERSCILPYFHHGSSISVVCCTRLLPAEVMSSLFPNENLSQKTLHGKLKAAQSSLDVSRALEMKTDIFTFLQQWRHLSQCIVNIPWSDFKNKAALC